MKLKKIIIPFLIGGAILVAALYAFIYSKSSEAAKEIEAQLNAKVKAVLASDELNNDEFNNIEYEPFICSGGLNISCYSKRISASDGEVEFVFSDVGFDIASISTQAITLKTSIKDIALHSPTPEDKQEQELLEILQRSIPSSFSCTLSFSHNDDEVSEKDDCLIKAKNAHYELKGDYIHKSKEFSGKNIAQIFTSTPLYSVDEMSEDYRLKLNHLSLIAKDKGFSKNMRRYYEIEMQLEDDLELDTYERYARQVADMISILGSLVIGNVSFMESFADGVKSYLVGKTDTIGFSLTAKPESSFVSFDDMRDDFPSFIRQFDMSVISK